MSRVVKVSALLLVDRLPLYATDPELRAAIFGARAKDPACCGMYDRLTKLPSFRGPWRHLGNAAPALRARMAHALPNSAVVGPACLDAALIVLPYHLWANRMFRSPNLMQVETSR